MTGNEDQSFFMGPELIAGGTAINHLLIRIGHSVILVLAAVMFLAIAILEAARAR